MTFISKCEFLSGWAAGIAGLATGHPLDTVKVRMQTTDGKSLGFVLHSTFHNEGIRGFYKGMAFPVLSAGVLNAIFFGVYGNSLRVLASSGGKTLCCEEMPIPRSNRVDKLWHFQVALAGFIGGFASTAVGCPVDCVKTKLQGNRTRKLNTWVVAKEIFKKNGIRGLYTGFIPMFCRDGPGFALYILAYEHILCMMEGSLPVGGHHKFRSEIFSGGLAGAISWSVAMPFDVVKSRIQMDDQNQPKYSGMADCFRKSFQKDGLPIFFKGFAVAVVRSFPVNAVTFVVYQYSMRECKAWTS
ncbi:hypothetical protein GE061_005505 [Apolygus lucorum]|uniref:Solute carrier family 25 member 45 n=1 Tax=Apolygus lucorum TaxID=248454 RepID=A0A8S9WY82_APOLU|nr:hypothetical protein GE061_005505 [Apolygus lucorum]